MRHRRLLLLAILAALPASAPAVAAAPIERAVVLIDARTGAVDRSFPDIQPIPDSVLSDGRDGWFVPAQMVGSVAVRGIAHLRHEGTLNPGWNAEIPKGARVGYAVRVGGRLYVSVLVGNSAGVEALDTSTGKRLWRAPTFAPYMSKEIGGSGDLQITALTASPTAVYVAGEFGAIGHRSTARQPMVALSAADGHLIPWRLSDYTLSSLYPHFDLKRSRSRVHVSTSAAQKGWRRSAP